MRAPMLASAAALLALLAVAQARSTLQAPTPYPAPGLAPSPAPGPGPAEAPSPAGDTKVFSMAELASANSEANCLLVIEGKVYNVTEWLPLHPGTPAKILPWCGRDATEEFTEQHGPVTLEDRPQATLPTYYVGVMA